MKQLARPLRGLASRFSGKFQAVPSVQTVAKIAKALGIPLEELVK